MFTASAVMSVYTGGRVQAQIRMAEAGLSAAREKGVTFENVAVTVGEGNQAAQAMILFEAPAEYIEAVLTALLARFEPTAAVTMTFKKARFASGFDMLRFAEALGLDIGPGEVEQ